MDEKDKQEIIARYNGRFEQYGVDIRTLASGVRERQLIRFAVMAQLGALNGASILDIGCGFADFYQYLLENGVKADYTGIDICPPFIDVCRERFPESEFKVADIQKEDLGRRFDYVVSSQAFNNLLKKDSNEDVIRDVIKKSYDICDIGLGIDMLSAYVDFRGPGTYHYSPEEIFAYCKTITKRVALRHDYPLFEFMVFLYRDFKGWA